MADTRHVGLVTPDNMPHLADLDDDGSLYPVPLTVACDKCGACDTDDYLVAPDMDREQRLQVARDHVATLGWLYDAEKNIDLCPLCRPKEAAS